MMTRTARGDTGRGLRDSKIETLAQLLLISCVVSRLLLPMFALKSYYNSVLLSAALWIVRSHFMFGCFHRSRCRQEWMARWAKLTHQLFHCTLVSVIIAIVVIAGNNARITLEGPIGERPID